MDFKRFHTGDLVTYQDIDTYSEVYGIVLDDDVFNDGTANQYVKVMWADGDLTTSNALGMVKAREEK